MVFYHVFLLSPLQCTVTTEETVRGCVSLKMWLWIARRKNSEDFCLDFIQEFGLGLVTQWQENISCLDWSCIQENIFSTGRKCSPPSSYTVHKHAAWQISTHGSLIFRLRSSPQSTQSGGNSVHSTMMEKSAQAGGSARPPLFTMSTREKRRVAKAGVGLPSQLERTLQLGWWGLHSVHLLLCPSKIFRHGNKKILFLVMVYSALLNNVCKALNLLLNKYVA